MCNFLLDHLSRNSNRVVKSCRAPVWLLFTVCSLAYLPARSVAENPQQLVRTAVENEIDARARKLTYWRYLSQAQDQRECRTEIVVETPQGLVRRLLTQNGYPLSPAEAEQEDKRTWNFIRYPRELKKQTYEQESDWQQALRLLKMLPDGLLYKRETSEGRMVRLSFEPNPKFVPHTFEARVLTVVRGVMLVDSIQQRLIEIRGKVSRDLEFGWGIFGKLNTGGTFEIRQEEIEPGRWELSTLDINITGRMWLFKTIGKQRRESRWAFRRVPEGISLEEATEMMKMDVQEVRKVKPPLS